MGELSRLSGQVLDAGGRAWAFNALMGPTGWGGALSGGWVASYPAYGSERASWRTYPL